MISASSATDRTNVVLIPIMTTLRGADAAPTVIKVVREQYQVIAKEWERVL